MPMQIILLERVDNLGNIGDVVAVKPGYARNFLLPQSKALRATKSNIAYFEAQKATFEKANEERRKEAEKHTGAFKDLTVNVIRHASESGHLYGSVTARDIADAIAAQTKEAVERNMVQLNQTFKTIGLFPVTIALHPEVKVEVTVNIARTEDEAAIQKKTGHALTAEAQAQAEADAEAEKRAKAAFLEDSALEAEQQQAAEDAEEEAAEAAKAAKKAEKKKAKEAAEDTAEESDEDAA